MLLDRKIPLAYIFGRIKRDILFTLIIWVIAYNLTHRLIDNPLLPISIPTFLGTAISVILSFKLNQSYDRWWEARKIWGSIVNDSRTLVLQLQSFTSPAVVSDVRTIALRQVAWCFSLGQSLRDQDAVGNLDKYLSADDITHISGHTNKPLAILQLNSLHISALKEKGALDIFSLVQVNHTLVNFSNAMGMAERIKTTVFPVTYRIFLHWIIYLFVVTLSISLYDVQWYYELPLLMAISTSFFLLEKAASQLQDPFRNKPTDIAVTTIATTIEINIKQLLGETGVPDPLLSNTFYSL